MKKFFVPILFMLAAAPIAAQTDVRSPVIPILLEREDNILFEIRLGDIAHGDTFDSITVEFGEETDLRNIKSLKLYYGGSEGRARQGLFYRPVNYIPREMPGLTLKAHPSYSVLQSRTKKMSRSVTLASGQKMPEGVNYFWVSIEMARKTPLDAEITASVKDIRINGARREIATAAGSDKPRRMGVGVRHAGDDGVAAYRIPGLVTTNRGTLLGVYDVRRNNSADLQEAIDIGVSRSTDGGRTWEPMRIAMSFRGEGGLPDAQNGVGDPSILTDTRTGTVWIAAAHTSGMGNVRAWTNSMPGMDADSTAQLVLARSDDDGRTWSRPINITRQVKDPSWCFLLQGPGRGITMKDGTLVFPIQFIDSMRMPHAGIMYSRDRGTTWHIHNPARSNTTEAQVAEVGEGVLMLNMRDNRGGSRAVSTTSDLGRTWNEHPSNRSALPEPVCMASLLAVPAADNVLGRDLLLFSNPATTKRRNNITVKASLDGGVTWLEENSILLDAEDSWGYSCLTLVDSETAGILYESSAAHMVFQTVKLKDLIKTIE
ncbi:MAG: exo-alpha-sialidase [Alistipes sp.]|nr:exo-alpha-sialidase [Alistipes sp.]